ncbi:MAG: hypothetical protein K8R88_13215 [Armatimonadetes bacterium]|nr:hypothetical protein [Armatimonadota bacterium]
MSKVVDRVQSIQRFALFFGLGLTFFALLPALLGFAGSGYMGSQYNLDDHMVYAAWMRQAQEGHFLFTNRFTTAEQPGITVHVYFLLLGNIARLTGIPIATTLARAGFSFLFVWLLGRLFAKSDVSIFASKLALTLACLGGGVGFMVWHLFGQAITRPAPALISDLMLSRLPTDVWQPEGFVFSSMLTNGLFMVSLCLIVWFFDSVLRAKDNKWSVIPGAISIGLLMNIHSYDVLLIGFVSLGFLATMFARKEVTGVWIGRVGLMFLGVLPAALWFAHVLKIDPVFQARAATPTFSPNFRQYLFGYLPGLLFAIIGFFLPSSTLRRVGAAALGLVLVVGFVVAGDHLKDQYWMGMASFGLIFAVGLGLCYLLASESPLRNLLTSWMIMGLTAPYFPGLFQRKLAMGLIIPIGALAALAIGDLIEKRGRSERNLATVLGIVIMSGTSLLWLRREFSFQGLNVSNTTVHPVFLLKDEQDIVDILSKAAGPKVVVASPGIPSPGTAADTYDTPAIPDLNPVLVGLAGCTAVAGHWSETPEYGERRGELVKFLFSNRATRESRLDYISRNRIKYIVQPDRATYAALPFADLSSLGKKLYDGDRFDLIEVTP